MWSGGGMGVGLWFGEIGVVVVWVIVGFFFLRNMRGYRGCGRSPAPL